MSYIIRRLLGDNQRYNMGGNIMKEKILNLVDVVLQFVSSKSLENKDESFGIMRWSKSVSSN